MPLRLVTLALCIAACGSTGTNTPQTAAHGPLAAPAAPQTATPPKQAGRPVAVPHELSFRAPDHLVVAELDDDGELLMAPTLASATRIGGADVAAGLHLIKLRRDGRLRWDLSFTSHTEAYGLALHLGTDGDIYLAGTFAREMHIGESGLTSRGDRDAFVARVGPDGTLRWMDSIGGPAREVALSLSVSEESQRLAIGGWAESSFEFAGQPYSAQGTAKDGFAAVYALDGTPLWAKRFRGVGLDRVDAVGLDNDALVVFGSFQNRLALGPLPMQSRGEADLFCARYSADGDLEWQLSWGSDKYESAAAMRVHDDGRISLSGLSHGDIQLTDTLLTARGQSDILLWQLNPHGEPLASLRLGGAGEDVPLQLSQHGALRLRGQHRGATNLGFEDIDSPPHWRAFAIEIDPQFRVARSERPRAEQSYLVEAAGLSLERTGADTVVRW